MKQGIRETVFTGGMLGDAALGSGSGHALAQRLAELSAASGLAGMLTANLIGLCSAVIALVLAWKQKGASPELGKVCWWVPVPPVLRWRQEAV